MFVDHLLLPQAVHKDNEAVKAAHRPLDLETVDEMYRYRYALSAHLIEEIVLQIDNF